MTVREKLINILEEKAPVYRQGSFLSTEDYPEKFFTYWNPTNEEIFYDNTAVGCIRVFYVFFYTNNPDEIETLVKEARKMLFDARFAVTKEKDYKADEKTYSAVMFAATYREDY